MTMFENRFYFTLEDAELFIRKTEQAKGRPVVWVIGLLLLLEAVLVGALGRVYTLSFWILLAAGILLICWFEFSFPQWRASRRMRLAQKHTRDSQAESVVTVDDDGVTLTEGAYTLSVPHSQIVAFLDCGEYLVLMTKTGPLVYTGIPLRRNGFTKGDLSSCYAFLSSKQGTVRWLS